MLAHLLMLLAPAQSTLEDLPPREAEATAAELDPAQEFLDPEATLRWQTGVVPLGRDLATLRVPPGFRYLDPEQAKTVLEDWWGNPPGEATLGMLFPEDKGPLTAGGWGVVLEYDSCGHVQDGDAEEIDYAELLAGLRSAQRRESAAYRDQGFPAIELVGWANTPRYDGRAKRLYWARELRVADNETNTLNYDVRALGRRGVLSMNAVAGMAQLEEVELGMETVVASIEFDPGQRYEDYVPGRDNLAAYGLSGLIAGKLAAKAGLFKGLLVLLVAGKKLVVLAFVAAMVGLKRLFGRKAAHDVAGEPIG